VKPNLNIPQKGVVIAALCVSHQINAMSLPDHKYNDFVRLPNLNQDLSQPAPRFKSSSVDLAKLNVNRKSSAIEVDTKLKMEFDSLVKKWKDETFFISSLTKQFNHPAYVRIMAMGKEGLPFVFKEMQETQDNWFYALKFMAGEDAAAGIKDFDDAKAAWISWGYKHNYI
jgi:hypothetical protein